MLSQVPQHLSNLRAAALVNQRFVEAVVKSSVGMFENSPLSKSVSLYKTSGINNFILFQTLISNIRKIALIKTKSMWLL